ncbi:MAG TPA: PQQ-dependent sugar dehydrogenase [Pseudonocardia sp.]|nr:PQQ-dependent sugar dehydrogenase [Pseudonocardia sp.]
MATFPRTMLTQRIHRAAAVLVTATLACTLGIGLAPAASAAETVLRPLATFDDYANGSLRGQGPWSVNVAGAGDGAIASAEVPATLSGKAMVNQLTGTGGQPVTYRGNAFAALGNLAPAANATAATVFFEFATTRLAGTRLHLGLSADASPGLGLDTTGDPLDLGDFGPQITVEPRGLVARDGATERVLGGLRLADNTVYRIWLVVDNAADTFRVYAAAPGAAPTRLSSGSTDSFAFRTRSNGPLVTFLHLNDPTEVPSADSYLDSIFVAPSAERTVDPSPAFTQTQSFGSSATGNINGKDGWRTSGTVQVVADPGDSANRVLQLSGAKAGARRAVPGIGTAETGTVFFRIRRPGNVDASLGLTDVDSPSAFTDFRVQAGGQNSATLGVRNGGSFPGIGTWNAGVWQCVWLVADHRARTVAVYSRGGPYPLTTRLPVDQRAFYAFRSSTNGALDTFYALTAAANSGTLLIDDIAVDPTHANLRVPGGSAGSCGAGGSGGPGGGSGPATTPVANPAPATPQPAQVAIDLQEVATLPGTGGTAARVNFVSTIPGSTRLAIPDLNGPLHVLDGGQRRTYLDVKAAFPDFVDSPGLGTGFGFVAFHPRFAQNGKFYTAHTEAGSALRSRTPTLPSPSDAKVHAVLTEWTASSPAAAVFSGTRREVLRIGYREFNHTIQQIGFNPLAAGTAEEGLLYIGSGDGEAPPTFTDRPQNRGVPQGKLLRIDPIGSNGPGGRYGIPAANPFVGQAGALGEIYALGLRNPHRFSWDPSDGRLFLGMIGEKRVDSVYEVRAGDNFGWNVREGAYEFRASDPTNVYPLPPGDSGFTYPVLQIGRKVGVSLVGGFVYRGAAAPALHGRYLFGDIVSGAVREATASALVRGGPEPAFRNVVLRVGGRTTTLRDLVDDDRVDLRFGQDATGELYLTSKANGKVWRVSGAVGLGG